MSILRDYELAHSSLLESLRLLRLVTIAHPEAEAQLHALAHNEGTGPGLRALLKTLHATGLFALALDSAEERAHLVADAEGCFWVN